MSLDKLAVIFIIIVLPISVILSTYTNLQVETLKLQSEYDSKLYNATYDAMSAYQLNSFNEDTSDLAASKMRLIKASANAFFNSMANNFDMQGQRAEDLQSYVPALVFTMYDGYYIYSRYTNTLDFTYGDKNRDDSVDSDVDLSKINPTYKSGDQLYGVQPFIYYSCRYKRANDDFVITYTLDNYISIQGKVNNKWINDSGYLLNPDDIVENSSNITYKGVPINDEKLEEYIGTKKYTYHKINGVKYYYDENYMKKNSSGTLVSSPRWFTLLNGKKVYTSDTFDINKDRSAYYYYKNAKEFTQRVLGTGTNDYNLKELKVSDATESLYDGDDSKVFETSSTNRIEDSESNFNKHRTSVIRNTIEKTLPTAIANYNNYSSVTNFQMPKLNDLEWEKLQSNIAIISFLQGLPIKNKIYNGFAIINNNNNSEVVTEESIYIANGGNDRDNPNTYYKINANNILSSSSLTGVFNIDLKRRTYIEDDDVVQDYYYPKHYYADSTSVVQSTDVNEMPNGVYAYVDGLSDNIKSAYYTALGRERFGTYKVNNNYRELKDKY